MRVASPFTLPLSLSRSPFARCALFSFSLFLTRQRVSEKSLFLHSFLSVGSFSFSSSPSSPYFISPPVCLVCAYALSLIPCLQTRSLITKEVCMSALGLGSWNKYCEASNTLTHRLLRTVETFPPPPLLHCNPFLLLHLLTSSSSWDAELPSSHSTRSLLSLSLLPS